MGLGISSVFDWNYQNLDPRYRRFPMDLDYPSQKRNQLSRQLNQVDRRYGSIILSNPKIIIPSKPIPQKLKKKLLNLIYYNDHIKLVQMLQQQTVTLTDEISKEGHAWTILHFICKNNTVECMELCLRWLYQSDPQTYQNTLNQKNSDGDTPLIVACHYKSNQTIKTMLEYGGVDIYAMNSKKLTAYQISLNSINQTALQMLMKYQLKIKRKNYINRQALSVPLPELQVKTFQKIYDWFIECFYFGRSNSEIQPMKDADTDRKMVMKKQKSEISEHIPNIQIFWSEPEKICQKKVPLFSAVSHPFLIKQSNIIVSNLFIIFQALAQHPELLKRVISATEQKYYVRFEVKNQEKLVWIDNLFPYFVQTKQPLFLSLDDQLWPMVLQKALSQYYNGYFQPAKIQVGEILELISANQSFVVSFNHQQAHEDKQKIRSTLLKVQSKNCLLILQPSQRCPFKAEEGRIESFSLLKILGDKFLINCPFAFADQHRDQRSTREMKLHQAHYNNPNCTTVWVNQAQFFEYFNEAVFCHTLNTSLMRNSSIKVTTHQKRAYLSVSIKERSDNDRIYLSFRDKNGRNISPTRCAGWSVFGHEKDHVEKLSCQILGITQISCVLMPSQVLLMCEFQQFADENQKDTVTAFCRSEQTTVIEALDCAIGDLEFIQCCKKYFKDNYDQYNAPIIQSVGEYVLAMAASTEPCYIPFPATLSQDNVVEGIYIDNEKKLEMFSYNHDVYFAVLCDVDPEVATNLKIISYESSDPTQSPQTQSV